MKKIKPKILVPIFGADITTMHSQKLLLNSYENAYHISLIAIKKIMATEAISDLLNYRTRMYTAL
jgi:uncharacterized protein (UPF0371 family)